MYIGGSEYGYPVHHSLDSDDREWNFISTTLVGQVS